MESKKNSMLFGMIEERYGTKFGFLNQNSDNSGRNTTSSFKKKKPAFLNTIKKMVRFQHGPSSSLKAPPSTAIGDIDTELFNLRNRRNGFFATPNSPIDDDGSLQSDIQWWDPPQDSFPVEFCQDTSLHGLKYIGQPKRHLSERIFWFIAFIVGLTTSVVLISQMWDKYNMNPVIVSFQPFETNVDQIPFPAITVCNMNKVMKSKAEDFLKRAETGDQQARQDVYYTDHVCSSTKSFARRFNFSQTGELADEQRDRFNFSDPNFTENLTKVNQFLQRAAQNCSEMIPLCLWNDKEVDCSQLFRPIETEFGKCCTFNMIPLSLLYTGRNDSRDNDSEIRKWEKWNIDEDGLLLETPSPFEEELQQFPRRQMKAGLTNGLSFLLNANTREYYCTSSDSVGFRMAAHLSVEVPKVADFGISLQTGSESFVDVVPQITMVDADIFSFKLEKRNCYKTNEFKLNHYRYYSVNNCIEECIANETKAECGCKRYYMPRNENETLCGPHKSECADKVIHNKTKYGIRNSCDMCLASCTEVYYELQESATPTRSDIWTFTNGTSLGWHYKLYHKLSREQQHLSIIHVFIGQDSFYAKVRKELYGPTDLFANTGGLMGLCLGFSGLSLMEVIYFLTLRAWWKSRRKQTLQEKIQAKWATSSVPPGRRAGTGESQSRSYYRSIFGEIHQTEERQ